MSPTVFISTVRTSAIHRPPNRGNSQQQALQNQQQTLQSQALALQSQHQTFQRQQQKLAELRALVGQERETASLSR